jgi:alpha-glucosidase (family GH31 glycosyl hydrolase)
LLPRKSKIRVPRFYSTHFPIPFFISNLKYGFEVDTNYTSVFDFAKTKKNEYNVESQSTDLSWTLYGGRSPAETLSMYTERRGRSLIPPKWAFGPWNQLGGEFNFTRDVFTAAKEFLKLDIPVSHAVNTLHFLPANSERGKEAFFKKQSADLLSIGVKQTAYYNPYVRIQVSPDYEICDKEGYFLKHHDNSTSYLFWYFGVNFYQCSMFDFTNEKAVEYFKKILQRSVDLGFKGWMQDYAEYAPYYSKGADGRFGDELHNPYPVLFQKATFEFLQQYDEDPTDKYAPDYIPYCRSGFTGTQKWQWGTWSGDPSSDWSYSAGLPAQVTALSNLGLSGVPYTSSDIGGFTWWVSPPPDNELWCRWAQFSVFTAYMHTQTGGKGFGPKTKIMDTPEGRYCWRKFAKLRTQLFHYIYNAAHDAYETGIPLMRHHLLEFPDDAYAINIGYDFTFGQDMLVSPVLDEGKTVKSVYLPKGFEWIDLMSNLVYDEKDGRFRIKFSDSIEGGKNFTVNSPKFSHIPVFIKSGSILPLLDPSVFTLNDASNENVISYSKRQHLLHLLIFMDSKGEANGHVWDGATLTMTQNVFSVTDEKNRIMIVQIPVNQLKISKIVGEAGELPRVNSYQELLSVEKEGISQWAFSREEKVIWVRMQPEVRKIQFIQ